MRELTSHRLYTFPFREYKHIGDLIDVEGPLLVHYMKGDRHALYYWVEGDNIYNRWLCFEVTWEDLYKYMNKHLSLYELINKKENECFYTVDIDKDLTYSNFLLVQGYALPDEYKPDVSSYYLDEVSPFYQEMFKDQKYLYKTALREKSVDLVISSLDDAYGKTNSLRECRDFLIGIDSSVTYFNQYHSFNIFKEKTSDMDRLRKMVHQFVSSSELRVANVFQNSFHISLSPDLYIRNDSFDTLRKKLNEQFINDVLRIDYNNQDDIRYIKNKYEDDVRKKIFEPFIRVINNPRFNLTFLDKKTNKTTKYERVSQYNKKLIIPKIEEEERPSEEANKIFITLTLEVDENKDLQSLSKKDLQQGTLFSTISHHAEQEIQTFTTDKYVIIFSKPITLKYSHEGTDSVITFEPLGLSIKHAIRNIAFSNFLEELERILEKDYLAEIPKNIKNKRFFDNNILDIKENISGS